ncbi:DUF4114 domain-containing protein [Magnetovibrio sp.]|uniref:DUF4114 domain-containing protein n=1 Tax=Magnetovibrio sp. TaxID=2024836 RepID=UPI002F95E937
MATNDLGNGTVDLTSGESTSFSVEATSGDTIVIPEGLNPATADYAHEGPDLILTWPDGSEVVVKDYFMVDPQPTLASEQGAEVPGDLAARLAGPVAPGMVAQAGAEGVTEQPIGQVEKLVGTVTAVRADGTRVELQAGDPVYQGDILETGPDGAIGVILADETTFSMAEDGRMVLDEMVYDPGTQEGSVSMSVMQGVFTFVSGQVAKTDPDAMTLHTPVATIGIRGTQVGLDLSDGQNLDIVLMEEADGFVGEVVVTNTGGVTVLNGANEFTVVNSFLSAPSASSVMNTESMINSFSGSLRYLPLNQHNVNDFGLQAQIQQGQGLNADGLADFETSSGEDASDIQADGLADFDTAAGAQTVEDELANFDTAAGASDQINGADDPITVAVDAAAVGLSQLTGGQQGSPSQDIPKGTPPEGTPPTDNPQDTPEDTAGAPTISVNDATVNEDGTVALDITVATTNAGDTIETITISGVPEGASLSAGTLNSDGTWTLSPGQLSGLTITPKGDYSGTFDLKITATATDGTATATTQTPATLSVSVTPDADTPTLSATAGTGQGGEAIALNITTAVTDTDTSETVTSITIGNVPDGAKLSAGTDNGDGTWTLSADDLAGLTITPAADYSGTINLSVTTEVTDTATGLPSDTATATQTVGVVVEAPTPVAGEPAISVNNATVNEDGTVALDISVSTSDAGDTIASITISGVPDGANLSAGTDNGDGSWTLAPGDLTGLTITPKGDYSGTFDLNVTATATDGTATATTQTPATLSVSVTPDADAPTLSATTSGGAEDTVIALNITTAVTDTDTSESITSITISNVPDGAKLSAGTDNGDGTWTLSEGQLDGLTLTPPSNFNGTIDLSVTTLVTDTATGLPSDTATATQSLSVTVTPVGDTPGIAVVGGGIGDEDTNIPIGITVTPVGGETLTNVVISGVPTGASLSLGTDNGDGTWTIDGADLADLGNLTMTPVEHYSGTPTLGVAVTTSEGGTASVDVPVTVIAVADAPTLDVSIGAAVVNDVSGSLTLENMGQASAGYENTIGWYRMDENGDPVEGGVIWADAKESVGDSFTLDDIDPSTIGFFLLSDGGTQNPGLSNGESVTFAQDSSGTWQVMDAGGNVLDSASGGGLFFTNQTLNADGYDHESDSGAIGNMNWEDLNGGGDQDFNDVNLNLTTQAGSGTATTSFDLNITSNLVDTDGSETLSLVVAGIPANATLSAGTDNGDGTWSLSPDQLSGLSITVPSDVTVDFDLTVTATATEPNGDTASVSQTVTADLPDAPTVDVGDAAGDEDTAIPVDITAVVDGGSVASVVISGVPTGATLSAGTDNGDGSWTLGGGDLDGLTITPPEDYSGAFDLGVSVTSSDGQTTSTTTTVTVEAVADAPTLSVSLTEVEGGGDTGAGETLASDDFNDGVSGWGGEVSSYYGQMNIDHNDTATKTFDFGAENAGKTITISFDVANYGGWDESGSHADYFTVTANGEQILNTTDGDGTQTLTATLDENGQLQLNMGVDATACQEGLLIDNFVVASGDDWVATDGNVFNLDITSSLNDTDGSETLSILVSGVPSGAELSAGTDNGDGTWTLSTDQLSGLTVTVPENVSGDLDLTVTATATEPNGDTASVSQTVTASLPEAPTVETSDVTGNEDTAIPVDISAAIAGGSLASVVISGVPSGATFSAGTDNGDGTWTMDGGDLGGLTITPPNDYSGAFNLSITATGTDGQTATGSSTVTVTAVADAPDLTTGIGGVSVSGDTVEGSDYSNINFGAGAGYGAGWDEKENDLSSKDDEWTGDWRDNDVDGESGNDVLAGMGGADDIEGGRDADLIFGGAGSDNLEGDEGNDIIFGGSGNNDIEGGSGNDFLIGGSGNDDIDGGDGNDVIFAGGGYDKVNGGAGSDVMVLSGAREDYLFTEMPGTSGQYVIEHLNGGDDGVNLVENIETFQFTDGQFGLNDMMASNPAENLLLTYDITIDTGLTDVDGSETLTDITVSGVPQGATFSAGTDNGDGTWTLGESDLDGLTLQVDETVGQDFSLSVSVTSVEASNGDTATSTSTIDVVLPEDISVEGDTSVDALDPLAAMFEDSDTLNFEGEEYDISSLTDGDSKDDYGGITPLGSGSSQDQSSDGGDTSYQDDSSDGYSSSDSGSDDWTPDDNC